MWLIMKEWGGFVEAVSDGYFPFSGESLSYINFKVFSRCLV